MILGSLDEDDVFVPGVIAATSTNLMPAGSVELTVAVADESGNLVLSSETVNFTSRCSRLEEPQVELTAMSDTDNGIARATYTVAGCTGNDTVTASLAAGGTQTAEVVINIAAADSNSLEFTSAEPLTLALKGTGGEGRSETSIVQFTVRDTTGAPVQGEQVSFSLSTTVGGLSLTVDEAITNESGVARTIVQAGDVATSVRVNASFIGVDGIERTTVSDRLVVSTGLPDENSYSLSVDILNPGGADFDGEESRLTIRMADKFNNPVPDGTTAVFTTEFGAVQASCETMAGQCGVTWNSQDPRFPLFNTDLLATIDNTTCPTNGGRGNPCPDALGEVHGLRSNIVVTTIGEESFDDDNANGLWDPGEPHRDLPEAFRDDNENGVYDGNSDCTPSSTTSGRICASGLEEIFIDFNENGLYDEGNRIYNGTLCPEEFDVTKLGIDPGDLTDAEVDQYCTSELVSVRENVDLVVSSFFDQRIVLTDPDGKLVTSIPDVVTNQSYILWFSDIYNNVPDAASEISIESSSCMVASETSHNVLSTNRKGAYGISLFLEADLENEDPSVGLITVTINTGRGGITQAIYSCTDAANAPPPAP